MTPWATSASISARISPGRRSRSLPRSAGTMQKVQVLLHPTEIDTHPLYAESRRVGSVEGNTSRASRISTSASLLCLARSSSAGSDPMLWVPKTTSTHGARSTMVRRSFCARQPPTAICMSGLAILAGRSMPRLPYNLLAAFSRTAQVLNTTTSATSARSSAGRADRSV